MKTVLDLIGEFGVLNDAKGIWGGKLPPEAERRWHELKSFYDLLMSKNGVGPRPVTRRFTAKEVEEKVTARERLRVPLQNEMIFRADSEFHAAMGVNLSRGGVFLSSSVILPVHTKLSVYLSSPDVSREALLEAEAEVAWSTEKRHAQDSLPGGMGLSFRGDMGELIRHLDALVIDSLVRRLSGVDANSLAPEFMLKEALDL